MGASIRLGKIFNIPIGINYSWILIFLLFTYLLSSEFGHNHPEWSLLQSWGLAIVTTILFFLSVLAHELSHSVVAVSKGIPVRGITLFIFGGVSQLARDAPRALTEFFIAIVGPVISIVTGVLFLGLWLLLRDVSASLDAVLFVLAWVNLSLGVFNMLPGLPLDGGRVLRATVWGISRNYWRATQVATRSGQALGLLLIGAGLSIFLFLGHFQGLWTVLIGGFLFSAATASYKQEQVRQALKSYRAADVMTTSWPLLPGNTPLGSPLVAGGLGGPEDFVAVSLDGRVAGVLTRRKLGQAPRDAGISTTVADVMVPLQELPHISPDEELSRALEQMESESRDRLAVFRDGVLLGFVTRDSAIRFIRGRRT